MLSAKCPKCGRRYFGWALRSARYQMCKCGAALEISDGDTVIKGYSPFEAEKYVFDIRGSQPLPTEDERKQRTSAPDKSAKPPSSPAP